MHRFLTAVCVFLSPFVLAAPARAAQPRFAILTTTGESSFYARPGDTVGVRLSVETGADLLTGVEVFLSWDGRLFQAVDADTAAGTQPAASNALLGDVLVNTTLTVADSLSLLHYAEANLTGAAVSGTMFELGLLVVGRHSGQSPIQVHADTAGKRTSQYSVPNVAGVTQELGGVAPLYFRDVPPELTLPDSLNAEEDEALTVALDALADDEEPADSLVWAAVSVDTLAQVSVTGTGPAKMQILPAQDYAGRIVVRLTVTDPAGGRSSADLPVRVSPVNDSPRILAGGLPDTLRLDAPFLTIPVTGVAQDVDDAGGGLVWSGTGADSVIVSRVPDGIRVAAPRAWAGTRRIVLRVADASGATDSASVVVQRAAPLKGVMGDFDGNDAVDFSDFLQFVPHYGSARGEALYDPQYDLDGDGLVDFVDFLAFAKVYGQTG